MELIHERSLRERAEARLTANYSVRKFIKKTKQKNTRIIHAFLTPEVTSGLFVRADGPGVSGRCGRWYHHPAPTRLSSTSSSPSPSAQWDRYLLW